MASSLPHVILVNLGLSPSLAYNKLLLLRKSRVTTAIGVVSLVSLVLALWKIEANFHLLKVVWNIVCMGD